MASALSIVEHFCKLFAMLYSFGGKYRTSKKKKIVVKITYRNSRVSQKIIQK